MSNEILKELYATGDALLAALEKFTPVQLNRIPFEGSWTAAQVADHLLKSNSGVVKAVEQSATEIQRPPDKNIQALKGIFLDYNQKFQSAVEILPVTYPQDKEAVMQNTGNIMQQLYKTAGLLDLRPVCSGVDFPGLGPLTRLEWLYLSVFHTQRHTRQIENIYNKIISAQE